MVKEDVKVVPLSHVRSLEDLCPVPIYYEKPAFMQHIQRYEREALRAYYLSQPVEGAEVWANYVVNLWEYERGVAEVTSYPWNIAVPMTDVCNAKCTFCSAPLVPDPRWLKIEEVQHFASALRYAIRLDLQGLGEPLAHPQFEEIVEEIGKYVSPVVQLGIITNGWLLSGRRWELLKKIHISQIHVSVNAATDKTHQIAMGSKPGTFDKVIKNIEDVLADTAWPRFLKVSLVVTRHSLPEVSDFIEMFVNKGVKIFQINALLPLEHPDWGFGHTDQYLDLWPGFLPNASELVARAQATINRYREMGIRFYSSPGHWLDRLDQWHRTELVQLQPAPPRDASLQTEQWPAAASPTLTNETPAPSTSPSLAENERNNVTGDSSKLSKVSPQLGTKRFFGRFFARFPTRTATQTFAEAPSADTKEKKGRIFCPMVYSTLSVFQHNLNVSTCCYMQYPPGYDAPNLKDTDVLDAMNSPAFRFVRRTLHRDHIPVCSSCGYGNFRS